jgi:energy-coupling factor transporter ATP-binding protein EcfA2
MKKGKKVGVAGAGGCGKDTFYKLFEKLNPNCFRISFADPLKQECKEVLKDNFGVDVWTSNRVLKDKFRLFLVGWAETRRNLSDGQYFINLARKTYEAIRYTYDYIIFPDVRFCEQTYDEIDFIKENGVLVYIDKHYIKNGEKIYIPPANEKERQNNEKLKKYADYYIDWPSVGDDNLDELIDYVRPVYEKIIKL